MTRRRIPKSKQQRAPVKSGTVPPRREVPLDLAALNVGASAPVSSMSLATSHPVDAQRYRMQERDAAAAAPAVAMDYGLNRNARDALSFVEATGWPGFQTLGLLAQLPEYRTMHETLADEVVRTWGKVTSTSDDEAAADTVAKLTRALERYNVRTLIREAVIHDQAYGGAHIFPRIKDAGIDAPADAPLLLKPQFVQRGSLDALVAIEPIWVSPNAYNASDPTKPNFYKPSSWYMLSTIAHATRLYTMVSRPVSDMLKAAYSFRGVSITQLAMPYVDNWLRTRQSVSDTIKQFSITYLKTDMSQMLQPGGAYNLAQRAQLFNLTRDNRNLAVCDMTQEEFAQINTPLSGLDALQAQSQEQMSAVSHIPLVKLTGVTPAGLNANSDGEIRVWYDFVAGYQSHNVTPLMHWLLQLIQLSEFGEIDDALTWDWNPLYELTDVELADVRSKNADTDAKYLEAQVITGEMVQQRLQQDPNSGYAGIIADRDELDEVNDIAKAMLERAMNPQPQESTDEPSPDATVAKDEQWQESKHPRANNGQFGANGGVSGGSANGVSGGKKFRVDKNVEGRRIEPVNEVDADKVAALAASMERNGWQGRPVLVYNGYAGIMAATGSHRIAAAEEAGIDVPVLELDEDAANYTDEDGGTISDYIGTGDDARLVVFLREAGDNQAADLVQAEIDANEAEHAG